MYNTIFKKTRIKTPVGAYQKIDFLLLCCSFLFLSIPIILWLLFWFKLYISIPASILVCIGVYILIRNIRFKTNKEYKEIFNIRKICITMLVLMVINILSGSGGFMFQNWDYHSRNATLHDLIEKKWPVRYEFEKGSRDAEVIGSEKGALSYYIAWFIPSAIIGKLTKSFYIASFFSFIWLYIGVCLAFYLLCRKMGKIKPWFLAVLAGIAGLDIVIVIIKSIVENGGIHQITLTQYIDTPMSNFFSIHGFLTHWFWVFHQAIPTWIVLMLLLNNLSYQTFGALIMLLMPYGPIPALGFIVILILASLFGFNGNSMISKQRVRSLFHYSNILPILGIVPIVLFLSQNSSGFGIIVFRLLNAGNNLGYIAISYVLFFLFEVLPFLLIINTKNRRIVLCLIALIAILPLFYIGGGFDVGFRATIPAVVLLSFLTLQHVEQMKIDTLQSKLLIAALLISSVTNMSEISRSIIYTSSANSTDYSHYSDSYKTFDSFSGKEQELFIKNFITIYDETTLINKYLVKD